jgi:hypothetical protein
MIPIDIGQLIYNDLTSSASLFTGRHGPESLADLCRIMHLSGNL